MALTTVRSTGISSLPAISAANLTSIPAANITGTLPAISGANLTGVGDSNPSFRVTHNGMNVSNGGTQTLLTFDTVNFDTASQWSTSNYRYTITSGNEGKYYFFMHVAPRTTEDDEDLNIAIFKNGGYNTAGSGGNFRWVNAYFDHAQMSNIIDMAVGDYVEFKIWHYLSATKTFGTSDASDSNFAGGFRLTT